jgi:hypothetical protein
LPLRACVFSSLAGAEKLFWSSFGTGCGEVLHLSRDIAASCFSDWMCEAFTKLCGRSFNGGRFLIGL